MKSILSNLQGGIVFDIGAHDGDYIRDLKNTNASLTVHAFEPHPKTFRILSARFPNQTDVILINAAVGDAEGSLTLFDYEVSDGSQHASLYKGVIEKTHAASSVEHRVDVVTLDNYAAAHSIRNIDFLKIDTEGNDFGVLSGAGVLLKNRCIKVIQFEFNSMNVVSRVFLRDFIDLLVDYDLFRLLPDGRVPISRYDASVWEIFAFQNIVAVLKTSLAPGHVDWNSQSA